MLRFLRQPNRPGWMGQAEKTLAYLHRLWGRGVVIETTLQDKPAQLIYDEDGFAPKVAA